MTHRSDFHSSLAFHLTIETTCPIFNLQEDGLSSAYKCPSIKMGILSVCLAFDNLFFMYKIHIPCVSHLKVKLMRSHLGTHALFPCQLNYIFETHNYLIHKQHAIKINKGKRKLCVLL